MLIDRRRPGHQGALVSGPPGRRLLALHQLQVGEGRCWGQPLNQGLQGLGFKIIATSGTAEALRAQGIPAEDVFKVGEGRPNIVDHIINGQVQWIINTPLGAESKYDERAIRRNAIEHSLPIMTTLAAAQATLSVLENELVHPRLYELGQRLMRGLRDTSQAAGQPLLVQGPGGRFMRQVIAGRPDLAEDLVLTDDPKQPLQRAKKVKGAAIVNTGFEKSSELRSQMGSDAIDQILPADSAAASMFLSERPCLTERTVS